MFTLKDQDKLKKMKLLVFTLVLHVWHRPIEILIQCFIDFLKQKKLREKKKTKIVQKGKSNNFSAGASLALCTCQSIIFIILHLFFYLSPFFDFSQNAQAGHEKK